MTKENIGYLVISVISIIGISIILTLDPIPQDLDYHLFVDQSLIVSIPNFWNVLSNLPFLLVGMMGLYAISSKNLPLLTEIKNAYILFFLGVTLVALGSGYYHLWPSNTTLLWDRLPMTIAFMALFSIIIAEFISPKIGKIAIWPLTVFGTFSVFYWYFTEQNNQGDLRLYILVQFLPILLIPLIILIFKPTFTNINGYWYLLVAYVFAKALEHFDAAIYDSFILSGHSIKHIVAALGIFMLLKSYQNRKIS